MKAHALISAWAALFMRNQRNFRNKEKENGKKREIASAELGFHIVKPQSPLPSASLLLRFLATGTLKIDEL
jgi:hypothetical protein